MIYFKYNISINSSKKDIDDFIIKYKERKLQEVSKLTKRFNKIYDFSKVHSRNEVIHF